MRRNLSDVDAARRGPGRRVETRRVYAVLSPHPRRLAPLGVMHWDGAVLRYAIQADHIPGDAPFRKLLTRTLEAKCVRAREKGEAVRASGERTPLRELLFVREGLGAAIFFGPVEESVVEDARKDFEAAVAQFFDVTEHDEPAAPTPSVRAILPERST